MQFGFLQVHFDDDQWEKTRLDGKKKLKATALPTNFCHIPPQKQKRKSLKKKLTYTPSPLKRARKSILEHSYASNKLFSNDDTPTIINSNFTILHENSIDNLNSITDDIINPEIENYSKEKLLQQLKNIKKIIIKSVKSYQRVTP